VTVDARGDEDPQIWFREHFVDAVDQVFEFLDHREIPFEDAVVADIGSGDGIIDLGLAIKGRPSKLVGYDVRPTDVDALLLSAAAAGVATELPECLSFAPSQIDGLPAPDDFFDIVVTWSVFEHVTKPVRMLSEIARVLKPGGVLFLQLWPLYHSEHGGHIWPHYDGPFPHLLHTDEEIRGHLVGRRGTDPTRDATDEYESLNRITLDGLQRALLVAGLRTMTLELLTAAVQVPDAISHLPLSLLGVGGVKLLAVTPP
jgi:SAM-dependent methyltransferase